MAKISAICARVIGGDRFVTNKGIMVRLARVKAPSADTQAGRTAKELLESLVLGQFIAYEIVAGGHSRRPAAEVWVKGKSANDAMRAAGYQGT
jgi:hypothetical protein